MSSSLYQKNNTKTRTDMSNFKPGDVVVCVTTRGFHYYPSWKYPRLYGMYTIDRVLSDSSVTIAELDNSRNNNTPVESDQDIAAFWGWHFKKIVGLTPKSTTAE